MQFKIPQNVDIDDKIVSFLTMKQLIILVVWWTFSYMLFLILQKAWVAPWLWAPTVLVTSLLTIAIAFLELNHLSFQRWVALWLASFIIPQRRYWYNGYVWSMYFNAFSRTQGTNTSKINKKINEGKKDFDIDHIKANIWNVSSQSLKVDNSSFELDDEQREEFYNRFQ